MFRHTALGALALAALALVPQVPANDALYARHGCQTLSVTRPNETKTNSTTADQDYTAVYQIPANYLITLRWINVDIEYVSIADAAASSILLYLKLGANKVYTQNAVSTPGTNGVTRSAIFEYRIIGTAAAGAAASVEVSPVQGTSPFTGTLANSTAAGNHATNGTLDIIPGMAFGTNTSGESLILRNVRVEGCT